MDSKAHGGNGVKTVQEMLPQPVDAGAVPLLPASGGIEELLARARGRPDSLPVLIPTLWAAELREGRRAKLINAITDQLHIPLVEKKVAWEGLDRFKREAAVLVDIVLAQLALLESMVNSSAQPVCSQVNLVNLTLQCAYTRLLELRLLGSQKDVDAFIDGVAQGQSLDVAFRSANAKPKVK